MSASAVEQQEHAEADHHHGELPIPGDEDIRIVFKCARRRRKTWCTVEAPKTNANPRSALGGERLHVSLVGGN